MCFRQRNYSERDTRLGVVANVLMANISTRIALVLTYKQQHFEKRPCKELKLISIKLRFLR